MRKFRWLFGNNEYGFTLIELLVVIAILGMLSAIAVPNIIDASKMVNVSAANGELATVQTAVNAYLSLQNPPLGSAAMDALTIDDVALYIRGGTASIKGVYNIDNSGIARATDRGTWPDNVGVDANGLFVRAP